MEGISEKLYNLVKERDVTSVEAAKLLNYEVQEVVASLKSLEATEVLHSELQKHSGLRLTELGKDALENQTNEFRILAFLNGAEKPKSEVVAKFGEEFCKFAFPQALRRKLITLKTVGKGDPNPTVCPADVKEDSVQEQLKKWESLSDKEK